MRKMYFPLMLLLSGCAGFDAALGLRPDGSDGGPGVVDVLKSTASALGPWGALAGGALGTAALWYRHIRILKMGKKDDDMNGIADDTEIKLK